MPRGRRNNRISDIDRQRIIDKYENGEDFLTAARELGIKRTTAYQIVRKHLEMPVADNEAAAAPGRRKKLDNECIDFLVMLLEANPTMPVKELNQTLQEIFPTKPRVSDVTISRYLEGELITRKICENIQEQRNSQRIKDSRAAFAHDMYAGILQNDRIYIDEMGMNLYTKRTYGRAPVGQRALRTVAG